MEPTERAGTPAARRGAPVGGDPEREALARQLRGGGAHVEPANAPQLPIAIPCVCSPAIAGYDVPKARIAKAGRGEELGRREQSRDRHGPFHHEPGGRRVERECGQGRCGKRCGRKPGQERPGCFHL